MKRGRDDSKVIGPLFPRLHVNDADKGGPRAPPRNKMALYELVSMPSSMFGSDAAPALPKQPHQAGSFVPSAFTTQGCGHEMTVLSTFVAPHTPVPAAEKVHPHSADGINKHDKRMGLERKASKHGYQKMPNSAGNVQMGVECSSLHPDDASCMKRSFGKKTRDVDDFRVPTSVQPGIPLCSKSDKDHHYMDRKRTTHSHLTTLQKSRAAVFSSQSHVQGSHGKPLQRHSTNCLMPQQFEIGDAGKMKGTVALHDSMEDSMSCPAIREKAADPLNACKPSSDREHPSCKLTELDSLQCESARLLRESNGSFDEARCLNDAMKKQIISNGRSGTCSRTSLDNNLVEPFVAEHCDTASEKVVGAGECAQRTGTADDADKISLSGDENKNGTIEDVEINDDISETSREDSLPGVDICPDDIVGLLGQELFWKARRDIVFQQRVFAGQVFELHRLINVQKLIAGSPHQLFENSYWYSSSNVPAQDPIASFLVKPRQFEQKDESYKVDNSECATENTTSANFLVDPKAQIAKQDQSHQVICNSGCPPENTAVNPPVLHDNSEEPVCQLPRDEICSGKATSVPVTSDNKWGAWCLHPPGNQWLIPVMSPSEGLIYKPYSGPCPPTAGFMAPVHGGCGPLSVPPVSGDLMRPAFGVPVPHQQQSMVLPSAHPVAPNYFPAPYGFPIANPLISSSPVDKVRQMAGPRPSGQLEQHSWSSCNMSNPKREAISECTRKVKMSEDNDVQGSIASCPGNRAHGGRGAMPQFPKVASVECSSCCPQARIRDYDTRVIKVVPHNPRSATESVARIFRSIQKERQQHDYV